MLGPEPTRGVRTKRVKNRHRLSCISTSSVHVSVTWWLHVYMSFGPFARVSLCLSRPKYQMSKEESSSYQVGVFSGSAFTCPAIQFMLRRNVDDIIDTRTVVNLQALCFCTACRGQFGNQLCIADVLFELPYGTAPFHIRLLTCVQKGFHASELRDKRMISGPLQVGVSQS